jgi:D-serine deaminase-like pyridoxal phosphate-dependent protein
MHRMLEAVGGRVGDLPSPALVVDLDAFEANLDGAQRLLEGTGTRLRPHVKAHRTPGLAVRQLGGVAAGVTCATVGEAEVTAAAGIDDLLIADEVAAPDKLRRPAGLARSARVGVAVDSPAGVEALGGAARAAGSQVEVLVDVDVGLHRCGVATPEEARDLAAVVERTGGLRLAGIMGYEGRLRAERPGGEGARATGHRLPSLSLSRSWKAPWCWSQASRSCLAASSAMTSSRRPISATPSAPSRRTATRACSASTTTLAA